MYRSKCLPRCYIRHKLTWTAHSTILRRRQRSTTRSRDIAIHDRGRCSLRSMGQTEGNSTERVVFPSGDILASSGNPPHFDTLQGFDASLIDRHSAQPTLPPISSPPKRIQADPRPSPLWVFVFAGTGSHSSRMAGVYHNETRFPADQNGPCARERDRELPCKFDEGTRSTLVQHTSNMLRCWRAAKSQPK